MLRKYSDLNEMAKDALRELGNVSLIHIPSPRD